MTWAKLGELLRRSYVQTAIMVVVIVVSVVAFWYGLRLTFRTESPLLAVASGSMEPVLYTGDLILIHGVRNASDEIHAAPKDSNPPGDIIVFHKPSRFNDLIVHRAIDIKTEGNTTYFETRGDANTGSDGWIPEQNVVGEYTGIKVPLLGYIALFFEPFEVKVAFILLWVVLLIILEFVPLSRKKGEEQS